MSKVGILLQILIIAAIALVEARKGEARTFRDKEIKPIKSFRNENGRIIDCVDIHKQPAFNNPLLINHKIQMQPSSIPGNSLNRNFETANIAMLETVDCPIGTVPIQRTTQQHVKKLRDHCHSAVDGNATNTPKNPEYHFAVITANENSSMPYYGVHAWLSVYHLTVSFDQYSESLIRLENHVNRDAIQFGWNVDPELYGDDDTHAFGYWTADGFKKTGCYNTQCHGFVQISRMFPLGAKITPVSTYGGKQYLISSLVYKDPKTGNWWIAVQENGIYAFVGYWPASLFTGLASHATDVFLGGAVYSPVSEPPPPMGSGGFVPHDYQRTCYISDISFVNASNVLVKPGDIPIGSYSDAPDCYEVYYEGNVGYNLNYTMIFGGPGGSGCVQQ